MPLSPNLASWLRELGHEAVHATEVGMHCAPDTEIMAVAKEQQRTVITVDLDYPQLLAISRDIEPSVILFRSGSWSDADIVSRMGDVLAALSEYELASSVIVVDRERIRRRRLPI